MTRQVISHRDITESSAYHRRQSPLEQHRKRSGTWVNRGWWRTWHHPPSRPGIWASKGSGGWVQKSELTPWAKMAWACHWLSALPDWLISHIVEIIKKDQIKRINRMEMLELWGNEQLIYLSQPNQPMISQPITFLWRALIRALQLSTIVHRRQREQARFSFHATWVSWKVDRKSCHHIWWPIALEIKTDIKIHPTLSKVRELSWDRFPT